MPNVLPQNIIDTAEAAVAFAERTRKYHGRRTERDAQQRIDDINRALERLKLAMMPLRSEIGRFPYGPTTSIAEANRQKIRDASNAIQVERRKLWKMLPDKKKARA